MVLYVFFLVQKAKLAVPPSLVSFLSELKKNFTNFYFFKLKLCQEAVSFFFLGLLQDEGKNEVKTRPTVVRLDHLRQALEKIATLFYVRLTRGGNALGIVPIATPKRIGF